MKDPEWTWKNGKRKRNCNRVLSTATENEIYRKIRDEYISKELYCSRFQLNRIALSIAEKNGIKGFKASRAWQEGFLDRYGLSFRRAHVKRRTEPNDGMVANFTAEFDVALAQYPKQLIYNMDETCWRVENFNAQGSRQCLCNIA